MRARPPPTPVQRHPAEHVVADHVQVDLATGQLAALGVAEELETTVVVLIAPWRGRN
jgi:hypothetical protein